MEDGYFPLCGNCAHFLASKNDCRISSAPCPIEATTDATECVRKGTYKERN